MHRRVHDRTSVTKEKPKTNVTMDGVLYTALNHKDNRNLSASTQSKVCNLQLEGNLVAINQGRSTRTSIRTSNLALLSSISRKQRDFSIADPKPFLLCPDYCVKGLDGNKVAKLTHQTNSQPSSGTSGSVNDTLPLKAIISGTLQNSNQRAKASARSVTGTACTENFSIVAVNKILKSMESSPTLHLERKQRTGFQAQIETQDAEMSSNKHINQTVLHSQGDALSANKKLHVKRDEIREREKLRRRKYRAAIPPERKAVLRERDRLRKMRMRIKMREAAAVATAVNQGEIDSSSPKQIQLCQPLAAAGLGSSLETVSDMTLSKDSRYTKSPDFKNTVKSNTARKELNDLESLLTRRERELLRKKKYRSKMTEEQKEKAREKDKERKRRKRAEVLVVRARSAGQTATSSQVAQMKQCTSNMDQVGRNVNKTESSEVRDNQTTADAQDKAARQRGLRAATKRPPPSQVIAAISLCEPGTSSQSILPPSAQVRPQTKEQSAQKKRRKIAVKTTPQARYPVQYTQQLFRSVCSQECAKSEAPVTGKITDECTESNKYDVQKRNSASLMSGSKDTHKPKRKCKAVKAFKSSPQSMVTASSSARVAVVDEAETAFVKDCYSVVNRVGVKRPVGWLLERDVSTAKVGAKKGIEDRGINEKVQIGTRAYSYFAIPSKEPQE